MKTFSQHLGSALLAVAAIGVWAEPSIVASKSQVKWTGYGIGKSHWGYVGVKDAKLKFDKKGEPVDGEVVVDLNKIEDKDLTDKDYIKKLEDHLKSPDFFDIAKFPTATYTAKSIKKNKDGSYDIKGTLVIKGKPEDKALTLKPVTEGKETYLVGKLTFDRALHDVKYNSGKFFSLEKLGDKTIKDNIDLELKLAVKK